MDAAIPIPCPLTVLCPSGAGTAGRMQRFGTKKIIAPDERRPQYTGYTIPPSSPVTRQRMFPAVAVRERAAALRSPGRTPSDSMLPCDRHALRPNARHAPADTGARSSKAAQCIRPVPPPNRPAPLNRDTAPASETTPLQRPSAHRSPTKALHILYPDPQRRIPIPQEKTGCGKNLSAHRCSGQRRPVEEAVPPQAISRNLPNVFRVSR